MQSKTSRVALMVVAAAIAVTAFLVLRPDDDDEDEQAPAAASQAQPGDGQSQPGDGDGDGGARKRTQGGPEPEGSVIELRDGAVVGGPTEIEAERGERIEFEVESDAPDEIHVHGYEHTEQVAPDDPAKFGFTADIEGIYEVEAHDIGHVVIAELRVSP
jgi:hypothetical protein